MAVKKVYSVGSQVKNVAGNFIGTAAVQYAYQKLPYRFLVPPVNRFLYGAAVTGTGLGTLSVLKNNDIGIGIGSSLIARGSEDLISAVAEKLNIRSNYIKIPIIALAVYFVIKDMK
jgi:hypothetical protein